MTISLRLYAVTFISYLVCFYGQEGKIWEIINLIYPKSRMVSV